MKETIILLPTYNEKDNISKLIPMIFEYYPEVSILVVDDNSIDGTLYILDNFKKRYKNLEVIIRKNERGLGTALIRGYREALAKGFKYLIQMDADLQHDPLYIKDIFNKLKEGCDLVVASRYVEGGGVEGWSFIRKIISKFANMYARFILGIKITDCTSGYRGFNLASLNKVLGKILYSKGFVIQVEVIHRFQEEGLKVCEVPFIFKKREKGSSKLDVKTIIEFFIKVLRLKF